MRVTASIAVIGVAFTPALAWGQSSQCQWIGNTWNCTQTSSGGGGINWGLLQQPDIGGSFTRGYEEAQREREERERARLEAERLAAQRDLYRAQTQALVQQGPAPAAPVAPQIDYSQRWMAAARPRMHLFPDFEKVVFAKDVAISPEMVKLMSGSSYAADIAYHLATHRLEALAIYDMQPLDAARAIGRLEDEARAREAKEPSGRP